MWYRMSSGRIQTPGRATCSRERARDPARKDTLDYVRSRRNESNSSHSRSIFAKFESGCRPM